MFVLRMVKLFKRDTNLHFRKPTCFGSSVRITFTFKLRGPGFKSRSGTVSDPLL